MQSSISVETLTPSVVFLVKVIFEFNIEFDYLDVGVILTLHENLKLIEPC